LSDADELRVLDNVMVALDAGIELIHRGHAPLVPHLTYWLARRATLLGRPISYDRFMAVDDQWLRVADALLYLRPSPGADVELRRAQEIGLRIFTAIDEVPNA